MKITVLRADDLDGGARARWLAMQRANPALSSPYFCPEFTLAVAQVCDDVRIAVMEESQAVVGFFPFQSRWSIGAPVGRLLSDHHGVVCAHATRWDWSDLLRACGLSCWRFDHLCAAQGRGTRAQEASSLGLDLSRGFDPYMAGRMAQHRDTMHNFERKARKLEREVGPLRFVEHTCDPAVFDALLRIKTEQYRRTGAADVFKLGWPRRLLDVVRHVDEPHFGGCVAALYAGDRLAAATFGMRSHSVWHAWFPVYDPALAKYSPGIHLLLRNARAVAQRGLQLLDLGKGGEAYKAVFADHATPLLEGAFSRSALAASVLDAPYRAVRWLLSTPAGQHMRPLVRRVRGL